MFFFSSRRRHTRSLRDWSSDVCSSDLRQQVQILFAKAAQAGAWFDPELLQIPLTEVQRWMAENRDLAVYRFAVEDLYRQQEHVLDEKGEQDRKSTRVNSSHVEISYAVF